MTSWRSQLVVVLRTHAVEFGDFKLSSGGTSDFYIDVKKLTLLPEGLEAVVGVLDEVLSQLTFNAIGGPTIGADTTVGAYLHHRRVRLLEDSTILRGFLVRPAEKTHGIASRLVGTIHPGDRCVVIEDVTTTGKSLWEACRVVHAAGGVVVLALVILDRSEGAAATLIESAQVPFEALATLANLHIDQLRETRSWQPVTDLSGRA